MRDRAVVVGGIITGLVIVILITLFMLNQNKQPSDYVDVKIETNYFNEDDYLDNMDKLAEAITYRSNLDLFTGKELELRDLCRGSLKGTIVFPIDEEILRMIYVDMLGKDERYLKENFTTKSEESAQGDKSKTEETETGSNNISENSKTNEKSNKKSPVDITMESPDWEPSYNSAEELEQDYQKRRSERRTECKLTLQNREQYTNSFVYTFTDSYGKSTTVITVDKNGKITGMEVFR